MKPHAREQLSGLEYMRRVAHGEFEGAPMVRHLGMRMTEVEEGSRVPRGGPGE